MGTSKEQCIKERCFVTDLMTKVVRRQTANINTPVKDAEALPMGVRNATLSLGIELSGMWLKYLRYHIWDPGGTVAETSAEWTK
jgi:hypothetical protein